MALVAVSIIALAVSILLIMVIVGATCGVGLFGTSAFGLSKCLKRGKRLSPVTPSGEHEILPDG